MSETMSEWLKKLMKQKNMMQCTLAEKAGVTESSVSHYIKGDRVPTSETIVKLAEALATTSDYLLFDEPFTEGERLNAAVDTVTKCAEHLTYDQKMQVVSAIVK